MPGDTYHQEFVTDNGVRLVVYQDGAEMLLIVNQRTVTLSHVEARRLGVSLVLGAYECRDVAG